MRTSAYETHIQILFQNFQAVLLEMQKFDFGQEFPFLHNGIDTFADDLDDFFRGAVDEKGSSTHGDFFLLANVVVAQYSHFACGYFVCDTLMNVDRIVDFFAVAQESHTRVRRETRMMLVCFHFEIRLMAESSYLIMEYPSLGVVGQYAKRTSLSAKRYR